MNTYDNIELPPLPMARKMYDIPGYDEEELKDYALANVLHHTASLQAEIDALQAEVDALREVLSRILENEASDWKAAEEFGGYVLDDELREEARAALEKENSND